MYDVDVVTALDAVGWADGATGGAPGGGGRCAYDAGGGGNGADAGPGLGRSGGTLPGVMSLISAAVMVVHRLDTNSAGARHSS
jgi:hypothetical protein